jgi:hypothetical protein
MSGVNSIIVKQIILLVLIFRSASLCFAQPDCVVTVLQAGNCNNSVIADLYVDFLCNRYGIQHLYYLKGIKDTEVPEYSERIFGRKFDKNKLVNQQQIISWKLGDMSFDQVVFIYKNEFGRSKNIFEFLEKDLFTVDFKGRAQTDTKKENTEKPDKDKPGSFSYTRQILVDKRIRFNQECRVVKDDTIIYILEPMFDNRLYKLSANSGHIIKEITLADPVPQDTILCYLYEKRIQQGVLSLDSLREYTRKTGGESISKFFNMALENGRLFLIGSREIVAFWPDGVWQSSYTMVYEYDLDFNYQTFYLGRYLNYSGFYPTLYTLDNFRSDRIQSHLLMDYPQELKMARILYFKLDRKKHDLLKIDKDTLLIPKSFHGKLMTNYMDHFSNFGSKTRPAWLMDPYPFIYFPGDSLFHNLVNDSFSREMPFVKPKGSTSCTLNLPRNQFAFILHHDDLIYKIIYDMDTRKIISQVILGELPEGNYCALDTTAKIFCLPREDQEENWIYFE